MQTCGACNEFLGIFPNAGLLHRQAAPAVILILKRFAHKRVGRRDRIDQAILISGDLVWLDRRKS